MDIESFVGALERDIARRKHELSLVRTTLEEGVASKELLGWVSRAAVTLSYAHWEGFVKNSSIRYIKLINAQLLRVDQLKPPLQAASLKGHFKRAGSSVKPCYLGSVLMEMDSRRCEIFNVNPEKVIDTESNLSSTVFEGLVTGIGLEYLDVYTMRHPFIDEQLVSARNAVVHGEMMDFSSAEAIIRIEGVLYMIAVFFEHLVDGARGSYYLN
ncbi:MAE_28990/MAE_18760 family HEPN-like nuclease [Amycolatopsis sp. VC5-11]|uniref:MAE_28990/MAE_18760 family HEPN-like nuclease n=1 Tax=Amycolatopsis sp. VC5-11 TaxID=3120156 RepID=UPI00300B7B7F